MGIARRTPSELGQEEGGERALSAKKLGEKENTFAQKGSAFYRVPQDEIRLLR